MLLRFATDAQTRWARLRLRSEEEHGATAVEYAIMLAFIAAVIVAGVALLGQGTKDGYEKVVFPVAGDPARPEGHRATRGASGPGRIPRPRPRHTHRPATASPAQVLVRSIRDASMAPEVVDVRAGAIDSYSAGFFFWIWVIAVLVLAILPLWGIFVKAGEEGWKAVIPIYNYYVLLKVVGRPGWWLVLYLVPIVNFVIFIIVMNDLSKSFGHGAGFTVGLVILNWIFLMILAFGSSTYRGPAAMPGGGAAAGGTPPRLRPADARGLIALTPGPASRRSVRLPPRWPARKRCSRCRRSTSRSTAPSLARRRSARARSSLRAAATPMPPRAQLGELGFKLDELGRDAEVRARDRLPVAEGRRTRRTALRRQHRQREGARVAPTRDRAPEAAALRSRGRAPRADGDPRRRRGRGGPAGERVGQAPGRVERVVEEARGSSRAIGAELAARRAEREALAPTIEPDVSELYEDLRRQKKGVGAAALVDGVCQGCHEQLSAVELDRLKRTDDVRRCEHCRRILVF